MGKEAHLFLKTSSYFIRTLALLAVACPVLALLSSVGADHGLSTWGNLKYAKNFTHFDYVNPKAPKGGEIVLGAMGTFDSLNPYIIKGISAAGITGTTATLLAPSYDEVNTAYAYVAEDVKVSADGLKVTFTLNPKAQFNNGEKITPEDVIFSFNILRDEGMPIYKTYYGDVAKAESVGANQVVFTLKYNKNRELPLILGQIPVLSKKFYTAHAFSETSLTAPPAAGAYEVASIDPGHSITYRRIKNWWGENLPSQRGQHNFDRVRHLYFRDTNALFEAFKAGQIHWRIENSAKLWKTAYNFPAVKEGRVVMDQLEHSMPIGIYGFFFNTRREIFKNKNVRKALTLLYNFEWINKNIFFNMYQRNLSFFPNSDFVAVGSAGPQELTLLEQLGVDSKTAPEYAGAFSLPMYMNETVLRQISAEALKLFGKEGWTVKGQRLVNKKGKQLTFEVLIYDKSHERTLSHYIETLKRIGINTKLRFIDVAAYQERLDACDFDMILGGLPVSVSPGNELRDYFTSVSVNQKGTMNKWGIKDASVDKLVEKIITAESFEALRLNMRVLDRLLIHNYYMIPAWYMNKINVVYWSQFARPKTSPKYMTITLETWWLKDAAEKGVVTDQPSRDTVSFPSVKENQQDEKASLYQQSPWWKKLMNWFLGD